MPTKTANFDVLELPLNINIFAPFFFWGVFSINGTNLAGQAAEKRKKNFFVHLRATLPDNGRKAVPKFWC